MLDPILSLSYSLHSQKGVYALLLGSGISTAAQIPTGWEITLDLCRKVAVLSNEQPGPDAASWFVTKFGASPNYSRLLEALARTPAERMQVLRQYFEPFADDREAGRKVPTPAHKAIAELVRGGYIRVVVTTNFDRLLEEALETVGIIPTVIASPEAATGMIPLVHSGPTIVKVNGDYLDSRIKNTEEELSSYDPAMDQLLDQIFDEYGLIICGWSAEWDHALCQALQRSKSHRFMVYWTVRSEPKPVPRELIRARRAGMITIESADQFFQEIIQKVSALESLAAPHPLSAKIAAATVKNYLVEPRHQIRLHDLFLAEAERVFGQRRFEELPVDFKKSGNLRLDFLRFSIATYDRLSEILVAMIIPGSYWGRSEHRKTWIEGLERLASSSSELSKGQALELYPALLGIYAGGIAAIAGEKWETLRSLLLDAKSVQGQESWPFVVKIFPQELVRHDEAQVLHPERRNTPLSDHLSSALREPFRGLIPADQVFELTFDVFEYVLSLLYVDLKYPSSQLPSDPIWAPAGSFAWRRKGNWIQREAMPWDKLRDSFFAGDTNRAKRATDRLDEILEAYKREWLLSRYN